MPRCFRPCDRGTEARRRWEETQGSPLTRLHSAVRAARQGEDATAAVQELIESADMPMNAQNSSTLVHEAQLPLVRALLRADYIPMHPPGALGIVLEAR
jgi:hypothetical protein